MQRVFETIGFGKVSTSGPDARRLGYLRDVDGISMNRDRLIADAKAVALARVPDYVPAAAANGHPRRRRRRAGGAEARRAPRLARRPDQRSRRAHRPQARVDPRRRQRRRTRRPLTEQQLLDLEREAFLSLCGERKTQERIAHTLKTGKLLGTEQGLGSGIGDSGFGIRDGAHR